MQIHSLLTRIYGLADNIRAWWSGNSGWRTRKLERRNLMTRVEHVASHESRIDRCCLVGVQALDEGPLFTDYNAQSRWSHRAPNTVVPAARQETSG